MKNLTIKNIKKLVSHITNTMLLRQRKLFEGQVSPPDISCFRCDAMLEDCPVVPRYKGLRIMA